MLWIASHFDRLSNILAMTQSGSNLKSEIFKSEIFKSHTS